MAAIEALYDLIYQLFCWHNVALLRTFVQGRVYHMSIVENTHIITIL